MTQGEDNKKMSATKWVGIILSGFLAYNSALVWVLTSLADVKQLEKAEDRMDKKIQATMAYVDKKHQEVKEDLKEIKDDGKLTKARVWEIYKAIKNQ